MATLLSLPPELLLRIFEYAAADFQPLAHDSAAPGCLALNKALRGMAIEAAAASVSLVIESDGSVEVRLASWLTRHEAWQHVRQLDLALCIPSGERVPHVSATSLPAHPARVKLHLHLEGDSRTVHAHPILWDDLLPFPSSVCDVKVTVDRLVDLYLYPPALLRAFPNLRALFVENLTFREAYADEVLSFPSLTRICEEGYRASSLGEFLERCPNLVSAALQASPARGPPALAAGLQELAFSSVQELASPFEDWSTDESDVRQFESLERYPSLCKLAFRSVCFEDPDQCQRALALIPHSVRHLAFHQNYIADLWHLLGACVMDACWLPGLETLFVLRRILRSDADPGLGVLQEACSRRVIRLRVLPDWTARGAGDPSWPDAPWL
jgi:hypothetical protein